VKSKKKVTTFLAECTDLAILRFEIMPYLALTHTAIESGHHYFQKLVGHMPTPGYATAYYMHTWDTCKVGTLLVCTWPIRPVF